MLALTAVQPDRIGGVDHHAEHHRALRARDGHEAGEDGGGVSAAEGYAGGVEAGLHDGVVPWVEVEVDGVAHGGHDGVGGEFQTAAADVDGVHGAGGAGAGGGGAGAGHHHRRGAGGGTTVLGGDEEGEGEGEKGDLGQHCAMCWGCWSLLNF